jgi:SAM-dependent methyltransferase
VASDAQPYVFGDAESDRELRRLRQIEAALDPASQRLLRRASPAAGWTCLEVGAGAGSLASWLADAVGSTGRVVALDVDPRFLSTSSDSPANVEVVRQDIREWERRGTFDLVHARYVLIHIADADRAIERMVASLRPGGWIALEEPDFLAARFAGGAAELEGAFQRVNAAIEGMFVRRNMDPALGVRLPATLAGLGLALVDVASEVHLVAGGSPMALMMRASTEQLRAKYVATGLATDADVDGYLRFAEDPTAWGIYYATVRVLARR